MIALSPLAPGGAQAVVYNSSANVDVVSGLQYPTALRQTVTLLFDAPLPAGSYRVQVLPSVVAAAFSDDEAAHTDHPVVRLTTLGIAAGADMTTTGAVHPVTGAVDFSAFRSGTPFLSQLQSDLSALLDAFLTQTGDRSTITQTLLDQIVRRVAPSFSTANSAGAGLVIIFLDPVSIDLADPAGDRFTYSLVSGAANNRIANAFVSVAGNVELIVMPATAGELVLRVGDVPDSSRGGVAVFNAGGGPVQTTAWTDELRSGTREFHVQLASAAPPINPTAPRAATSTDAAVALPVVARDAPSRPIIFLASFNTQLSAGGADTSATGASGVPAPTLTGPYGAMPEPTATTQPTTAPAGLQGAPTTQPTTRPAANDGASPPPIVRPAAALPSADQGIPIAASAPPGARERLGEEIAPINGRHANVESLNRPISSPSHLTSQAPRFAPAVSHAKSGDTAEKTVQPSHRGVFVAMGTWLLATAASTQLLSRRRLAAKRRRSRTGPPSRTR